jgi:signal transduction histidine kinase
MIKYFLIYFATICAGITASSAQIASLDSLIQNGLYDQAYQYVSSNAYVNTYDRELDYTEIFTASSQLDSSFIKLLAIDTSALSIRQKARYFDHLATAYVKNNEEDFAFSLFQKAHDNYTESGQFKKANKVVLEQFLILVEQKSIEYKDYDYLEKFEKAAEENQWSSQLAESYVQRSIDLFIPEKRDSAFQYLNRAYKIHKAQNDLLSMARIDDLKGLYLSEITQELDSSKYYFEKALKTHKASANPDKLFYTLINYATYYRRIENITKAIELQREAKQLPIRNFRKKNLRNLYKNLSKDYHSINNDSLAYIYSQLQIAYIDSVDIQSQNINLIKLNVVEKDKRLLSQKNDLLVKEKQKIRNQNIALALGSFLILSAIIAALIYRNIKRKQRIAEQAQELEIQRTEKILKEKEIETINAMVSGQEKERHRLAGELHDNLGSTLATVRMQVENLERNLDKVDNPKALLTKTHNLINEAYEKVRTISHERNVGVLAKDGLLPAIQRLANTISSDDGLSIEVEEFGLEQRLSNELEITIFRIVQELVTNIVKHAKATEATISLTQHEGELNILIEDNGKGFKVGTLQNKNGMGLGSIERRVGTHIIIDIPL